MWSSRLPTNVVGRDNHPIMVLKICFKNHFRLVPKSHVVSTGIALLKNRACQLWACFPLCLFTKSQRILPQWQTGCFTRRLSPWACARVCERFFLLWQLLVKFSSKKKEKDRPHHCSALKIRTQYVLILLLFCSYFLRDNKSFILQWLAHIVV